MSLRIVPALGQSSRRGAFDAAVSGGMLLLPEALAGILLANRVTTAERLAELVFDFPGTLASVLSWQADDVDRARSGLVNALRGYVDEQVLKPSEPFDRGFGALPPRRQFNP